MKQLSPQEFEDRKRHLENLRHVMPLLERNTRLVDPVVSAVSSSSHVAKAPMVGRATVAAVARQEQSQAALQIEIDMRKIIEDDKYDDLLDELLSDDNECSPKSELVVADHLDMLPSPTFEGFWNSGDDDEEEDEKNKEAVVDDGYYCLQDDIHQLSSLINTMEVAVASHEENNENTLMSPGKSDVNAFAENVLGNVESAFSPSTSTKRENLNDILPTTKASAVKHTEASNHHQQGSHNSDNRAPFAIIDHANLSPEAPRTMCRRSSTGCIPETSQSFLGLLEQSALAQPRTTETEAAPEPMDSDMELKSSESSETLLLDLDRQIKPTESAEESVAGDCISDCSSDSKYLPNSCLYAKPNESTEESPSAQSDAGSTKALSLDFLGDEVEIKPSASPSTVDSLSIAASDSDLVEITSSDSMSSAFARNRSSALSMVSETMELTPSVSSSSSSTKESTSQSVVSETLELKPSASASSSSTANDSTLNHGQAEPRECPSSSYSTSSISISDSKENKEDDPDAWAYSVWRRKGLMAESPTGQQRRPEPTPIPPQPPLVEVRATTSNTAKTASSSSQQMARLRGRKDRQSLPAKLAPPFQQKPKTRNGAGFSILLSRWKGQSNDNANAHFLSPKNRNMSPIRSTQTSVGANVHKTVTPNKVAADGATKEPANVEPAIQTSIDATPVLSPGREGKSLGNDNQKISLLSSNEPKHRSKASNRDQAWPTPSKNKNALSRYLQCPKPTPTKMVPVQSFGEKYQQKQVVNQAHAGAMDNMNESFSKSPAALELARPMLGLSPLTTRTRSDDRLSPTSKTSTIPFLSPGDDSLLDPRDVMRHRRQVSDHRGTSSRNTSSTPMSLSVPCKEIFVIQDDQVSIVTGLHDDLKSIATESQCQQSVDPDAQRMHFTNLDDIMKTRVDSMSFDSQSDITHLTFRTETLRKLDSKVNAITKPKTTTVQRHDLDVTLEENEDIAESPTRENLIAEMGEMTGAAPDYSERPWRKDLLVRNVTTAMEKANGSKFECDCDYSLAMFSAKDEMVDFFLPLMAVTCSCRKSKKLVNPEDPISLENILRPWQITFLKNFGIVQGDQLVKAHHRSSRSLARSLHSWREKKSMTAFRVGSCGMALQIWANTCKAYVRSIRKQVAAGVDPIERPNTVSVLSTFLEKMPTQMHQRLPQPPRKSEAPEAMEEI